MCSTNYIRKRARMMSISPYGFVEIRTGGFKVYSGLKQPIFLPQSPSVDNIYRMNAVLVSHSEYVPIIDALYGKTIQGLHARHQ